jgi:hypothetical protein
MHPSNGRRTSEILDELARCAGARVALRDLVDRLGERAFGLLMLVFSLPNTVGLGTIPGLSTVFGVPQVIFAVQMIVGRERPWLPAWLLARSISAEDFRSIVAKSRPQIERVERLLRPRLQILSSRWAERLLGLAFLVLATIVALPIPGGNWPPAIAMALIAIGMIERDGLFVLIGLAVSVVAVVLALAVIGVAVGAIWYAVTHLFGR